MYNKLVISIYRYMKILIILVNKKILKKCKKLSIVLKKRILINIILIKLMKMIF